MMKQLIILVSVLAMVGCTPKVTAPIAKQEAAMPAMEDKKLDTPIVPGMSIIKPGIDVVNMDKSVSPKNDFYNYANGGWMKNTEIPADESRWGGFSELGDNNNKMVLALVDKALKMDKVDANSDEGKVVNFFNTAMNMEMRNAKGTAVIQPYMDKVKAIKNTDQLLDYIIESEPYFGGFFGVYVYSDPKNSNMNALYLGGGNLGLPDRDYYTNEEEDDVEKRAQYVTFTSNMLQMLDLTEPLATTQAKRILALETRMAKAMLPKEERRNPLNTYNPMTLAELQELAPNIDWKKYLDGIGAKGYEQIIVSQPKYIKEVNDIWKSESLGTIKEYMRWNILNDAAGFMSQAANDENFDFYGKKLRGQEEQKPLNERVLRTTSGVLGEAIGKLYVKEYFPPEAKATAVQMVEDLREAYKNRINALPWMSAETKVKAIQKLNTFRIKIGYPDKWKDYSNLKVETYETGGSFYGNMLNARKWGFDKNIVKIGKEVDKDEWFMSPQTVNAYYNPPFNEIVFPAAILQAPFFDFKADPASNYGGIGGVIGHEFSHGFDDQGAKYDAEGNLNNWWTDEDLASFEKRGNALVAQYNAYEPLPGVNVNGKFTLGENIGDLGGINAAYDALQIYEKREGQTPKIDGLTQDERFFINWATIWRTKMRDEAMKNRIKTDPHSPGQYRAIGPLVNMEAFYKTFDIGPGDGMYKAPEDRVIIW